MWSAALLVTLHLALAPQPPAARATIRPAANAGHGDEMPRQPAFAVLDFTVSEGAEERGRALATLVAARIERRGGRVITRADISAMLEHEQHRRTLEGCEEGGCMAEIAGALGVRFVVKGQLERIGPGWLAALSLYEGTRVRRFADTVAAEADLVEAFERGAGQVADWTGLATAAGALAPPQPPNVDAPNQAASDPDPRNQLGIKIGGARDLGRFNVEYGRRVHWPEMQIVAQASVLVSGGAVTAVPAGIGLRWTFFPGRMLRPYAGAIAGVSVVDGGAHLNLTAVGGLAVLVRRRYGLSLEVSADTASLRSEEGGTTFAGAANLGVFVGF